MELQTNIAANGRAIVLSAMALNAAYHLTGGDSLHAMGIPVAAFSLGSAYLSDRACLLGHGVFSLASSTVCMVTAIASWALFIGGLL